MAQRDLIPRICLCGSVSNLLTFIGLRVSNDKTRIIHALVSLIDMIIEHKVAAYSSSSLVWCNILAERAALEIYVLRHRIRVSTATNQTGRLFLFVLANVKQVSFYTGHKLFHWVHVENGSRIPLDSTVNGRIVGGGSLTYLGFDLRVMQCRCVLFLLRKKRVELGLHAMADKQRCFLSGVVKWVINRRLYLWDRSLMMMMLSKSLMSILRCRCCQMSDWFIVHKVFLRGGRHYASEGAFLDVLRTTFRVLKPF